LASTQKWFSGPREVAILTIAILMISSAPSAGETPNPFEKLKAYTSQEGVLGILVTCGADGFDDAKLNQISVSVESAAQWLHREFRKRLGDDFPEIKILYAQDSTPSPGFPTQFTLVWFVIDGKELPSLDTWKAVVRAIPDMAELARLRLERRKLGFEQEGTVFDPDAQGVQMALKDYEAVTGQHVKDRRDLAELTRIVKWFLERARRAEP